MRQETGEWIKKAQSHELYYPTGIQATHENRATVPYVCLLAELKGLTLPPLVKPRNRIIDNGKRICNGDRDHFFP